MATVTLDQLKARFTAMSTPSAADFADLIDTLAAMPSSSVVSATPSGPAGGGLTGTYPNPTIKPYSVTLDRLDPAAARSLAPSAGDIVVPVYEQTTGAINYRNWNGLPGIALGSGGSSTPVPPGATPVAGNTVLLSTGWRPFPVSAASSYPFVYTGEAIGSNYVIWQMWGEAMCLQDSNPSGTDTNRTGYSAGTILPLSSFFTTHTWPVGSSSAPRMVPYFSVYLTVGRQPSVSANLQMPYDQPTGDTQVVVLAKTSNPQAAGEQMPTYRINNSNWQFRLQTLAIIS